MAFRVSIIAEIQIPYLFLRIVPSEYFPHNTYQKNIKLHKTVKTRQKHCSGFGFSVVCKNFTENLYLTEGFTTNFAESGGNIGDFLAFSSSLGHRET